MREIEREKDFDINTWVFSPMYIKGFAQKWDTICRTCSTIELYSPYKKTLVMAGSLSKATRKPSSVRGAQGVH